MAERVGEGPLGMSKCDDDYSDPSCWVAFVFQIIYIKRRFIMGTDHFSNGPEKGLEFLKVANFLPKEPDAESVAYFFRSQKIQRVLKAFSERNNLPREFLSELFHSICKNEIRMVPEQGAGFPDMTSSRWIDLMHKSENVARYIVPDNLPYLDKDMFAIVAGPTVAAIAVVFDHAEDDYSYQTCIDGFLAVAEIAAFYHVHTVLDDLVISLCKFTTLLNHAYREEFLLSFAEDSKAKIATLTVFTIANRYGDCIRNSWRNVLDCILCMHKFELLSAHIASDIIDDTILSAELGNGKPLKKSSSMGLPKRSSGLVGRFSQLLSSESEELVSQPTEEELAARQCTLEIVQKCQINNIFLDSKFLQADSLLQLSRAIIAAGQTLKGTDDEAGAVFCLGLLIGITLNNRDRISLLWKGVYEHISKIVQSTVTPCVLAEKVIFTLLSICQRLLPYKENLVDDLLKSLQLVLKLDARVAKAYCEQISQEVGSLIKANVTRIRSHSQGPATQDLLDSFGTTVFSFKIQTGIFVVVDSKGTPYYDHNVAFEGINKYMTFGDRLRNIVATKSGDERACRKLEEAINSWAEKIHHEISIQQLAHFAFWSLRKSAAAAKTKEKRTTILKATTILVTVDEQGPKMILVNGMNDRPVEKDKFASSGSGKKFAARAFDTREECYTENDERSIGWGQIVMAYATIMDPYTGGLARGRWVTQHDIRHIDEHTLRIYLERYEEVMRVGHRIYIEDEKLDGVDPDDYEDATLFLLIQRHRSLSVQITRDYINTTYGSIRKGASCSGNSDMELIPITFDGAPPQACAKAKALFDDAMGVQSKFLSSRANRGKTRPGIEYKLPWIIHDSHECILIGRGSDKELRDKILSLHL